MKGISVQVHFHKTQVREDQTSYVDLLTVDGVLYTMLLEKVKEPNQYEVVRQEEGDHFEEFLK